MSQHRVTPEALESAMRKSGMLRDAGDGEHVLIDFAESAITKMLVTYVSDNPVKAATRAKNRPKRRKNPA